MRNHQQPTQVYEGYEQQDLEKKRNKQEDDNALGIPKLCERESRSPVAEQYHIEQPRSKAFQVPFLQEEFQLLNGGSHYPILDYLGIRICNAAICRCCAVYNIATPDNQFWNNKICRVNIYKYLSYASLTSNTLRSIRAKENDSKFFHFYEENIIESYISFVQKSDEQDLQV